MKSKKEIIEILMYNFDSVYCDTCNGKECDGCYRKYMNWGLSFNFAESVAEEILK